MNRALTVKEVVSNARTVIPEALGIEEIFMRQWVYWAIRQIGVTKESIKTTEVVPVNLSIRKPDDFIKGKDMGLFNSAGQELLFKHEGKGTKAVHNENSLHNNFVQVSEDDNFYYLSSNGTDVAVAKLRYFALPIDGETGDLVIPEPQLYSIVMFLKYMVAFRTNDIQNREWLRREWEREAARARANNILPDELEFKTGIVKEYMSMIHVAQPNRF